MTSLTRIIGLASVLVAATVAAPVEAKAPAKTASAKGTASKAAAPSSPTTTTAKPWTSPGWAAAFVAKANTVDTNEPSTLLTGGKAALHYGKQNKPKLGGGWDQIVRAVTSTGQDLGDRAGQQSNWLEARTDGIGVEGNFRESSSGSGGNGGFKVTGKLVDASTIQPGCAGMIRQGWFQAIWVDPGVPHLRLYASAEKKGEDVTLIVATPSGDIVCNDDKVGKDPELAFPRPASGIYTVWVGLPEPDTKFVVRFGIDPAEKYQTGSQSAAVDAANQAAFAARPRSSEDPGKSKASVECGKASRGKQYSAAAYGKCMQQRGY